MIKSPVLFTGHRKTVVVKTSVVSEVKYMEDGEEGKKKSSQYWIYICIQNTLKYAKNIDIENYKI